jgi:hypothetical protein
MTYDQYKTEVVKQARKIYPHPICVDNVRDFYNRGESVKSCAEDAAFTSCLWDNGPECLTTGST